MPWSFTLASLRRHLRGEESADHYVALAELLGKRVGQMHHALASRLVHRLRGEGRPPSASRRERALQMFDNYSPRFQHRHTVDEVLAMFEQAGFVDAREVTLPNERRHMLAVLGWRPASK